MAEESLISVIIPVYNEAVNIPGFFAALNHIFGQISGSYSWEIIFVNDGSTDGSRVELERLEQENHNYDGPQPVKIKILEFSRNFGKEAALSAGLKEATGQAALMIDADFQHPVELIPEFLKRWEAGGEVVIGIRRKNHREGFIKRLGSHLFYKIIRSIAAIDIKSNETDFRLLDRQVIDAFNDLTEKNRMTRALIDWLGFRREYLEFEANARADGRAGYSLRKLIRLAINSFVSLSLLPLKFAGYLGLLIIFTDGPFGLYVFIGKYLTGWAFPSSFSGSAQLALLITFLVGIVLSSLGLVALYIANIHSEVLDRPLYILRKNNSTPNLKN